MKRPEEALHRSVVAQLRARLPEPWLVWHTPNGGGRSKAEAGILKAMGVLAGFPDLLLLGPPPYCPICIELKAPPKPLKSGRPSKAAPKLSPAQVETINRLGRCGVPTLVCDNVDEVMARLTAMGVPLRGRTA